MINIDLRSSATSSIPQLAHQIHDGETSSESFSESLLGELGLACPLKVRAIQHRCVEPPPTPKKCQALRVHDGLVIWLGKAVPSPGKPFDTGDAFVVANTRRLITAFRLAIISMRQCELKSLRSTGRGYLSDNDERELMRLTTIELRRSPDSSLDLVTLYCKSLAVRHHRILNSLRRKLLELMSAVTSAAGVHSAVSHDFIAIAHRVMSTYVISDFVEWFPTQLIHLAKRTAEAQRATGGSYSKVVSDACSYLEQQFTAPISLSETAQAVHVSKEHLARIFKAETGHTVGQRLNQLRIEYAKDQLAQADSPVKDIATACGFTTQEHFRRTFRRAVGITPGQYRHRHGG